MIARIAFCVLFAATPVYPSFILLTPIDPAGVSIVPRWFAAVLLGCVAIAVAVLSIACVRATGPRPPTQRAMWMFIGAMMVAALCGFDPAAGLAACAIVLMTALVHLAVWRFYAEEHTATAVLTAFVSAGTIAAIVAITLALLHRPPALAAIGHGRAIGTFLAPNECAGFALMLLCVAAGLAFTARARALRLLGFAGAAAGTIALALSYSRAGWIGLAAGGAFAVALLRPRWLGAYLAVSAAIAALMVFLLRDLHHNPSEDFTRIGVWLAGLRVVERFPLTGVGPMAFWRVYPLVRPPDAIPAAFHPHNILLSIAAETGVLGLSAFVATWVGFARAFRDELARALPRARVLGVAVATGIVATWVQGMLDMVTIVVLAMWFPFMAVALRAARYGLGGAEHS